MAMMTRRFHKLSTLVLFGGTTNAISNPVSIPSSMRPIVARHSSTSLDSEESKVFYALGVAVGKQLGDLNVFNSSELDSVLLGMKDSILAHEPKVEMAKYAALTQPMFQKRLDKKLEASKLGAKEALETAGAVTGAVTTDTGLVFLSTQEGSGTSPSAKDTVKVHYEGRLLNGSIFDSSIERGEPIEFPLSGVIAGWTEGLQMMKPGGKATLTIPSHIAYGDRGSPPVIPPGATLVFHVELIEVK